MIVFNLLFLLVIVTSDARSINKLKPSEESFLYEGDILLTKKDLKIGNTSEGPSHRRNLITKDLSRRWTFPIKYRINKDVDTNAILAGIAKWEEETCARFVRQGDALIGNGLDFIKGEGCWSYVGKRGNTPQEISIGAGCTSLGIVTHEIGHALGFFHQHTHPNRNAHVLVQFENINSTERINFELESRFEDFGIPYDHGSVMHYDGHEFSNNNKLTIKTIDPNYQSTIGQDIGPSFADVKKLNFAYCNATCTNSLDCKRGGYINPNNCNECKCPAGFTGTFCQRVNPNNGNCGKNILTATQTTQTVSAKGAQNCYFLIKAPVNKRVFFALTKRFFPTDPMCAKGYVEINYNGDFTATGARYCRFDPTVSQSKTEELLIIYNGAVNTEFSLNYRYEDPTNSASPAIKTKKASSAVKKMNKN